MGEFILFENKGEVPVNAFKLLGASSKRNDSSKIGFFGTGLKYAIAVILRHNIGFRIFSGKNEVKIGLRKTKFFDDTVEVMTVNNEKTSITLDAGIDWEPWFAIREVYSNTIDENGTMMLNNEVEPKSGYTRIYIDYSSEELSKVFKEWSAYFSDRRDPRFKSNKGSIYPKLPTAPEFIVFRKGIRAYKSRIPSMFDYDLNSVDINESRVAKHDWQVKEKCSELLASSDASTIKEFLRLSRNVSKSEYIEWDGLFWQFTASYEFSEAWLEVLGDKRLVPADHAGAYDITETTQVMPDKLIELLVKRFGDAINTVGSNKDTFTVLQTNNKHKLQPILDVYTKAGLDWELENLDIVEFFDKDILGQAKDGRVLLSSQLFTPAKAHEIAPTLLEEIIHAKTGYGDGTRQLQNYLIQTIANLSKELAKEMS